MSSDFVQISAIIIALRFFYLENLFLNLYFLLKTFSKYFMNHDKSISTSKIKINLNKKNLPKLIFIFLYSLKIKKNTSYKLFL